MDLLKQAQMKKTSLDPPTPGLPKDIQKMSLSPKSNMKYSKTSNLRLQSNNKLLKSKISMKRPPTTRTPPISLKWPRRQKLT